MKILQKMERKFGRYAIKNLTLIVIICYVIGYVFQIINPDILYALSLNPYLIIHRFQIWRLVTWILIPPSSLDIWTLIMLFFYFSIGVSLEHTWGDFRYNVFIISGIIFDIIGSFAVMGIYNFMYSSEIAKLGADIFFASSNYAGGSFLMFSTYYINMSIFLAYAATYPNNTVLFMFFIPLKMKWLGIIYGIMLAYQFVTGDIIVKVVILASMLNFIIFFLLTRNYVRIAPENIRRRHEFKKAARDTSGYGSAGNVYGFRTGKPITRHKCAICGRTELDDPNLEFRFCSKCDGNYEYCSDHLYNHVHVKKTADNINDTKD